MRIRGGNDRNGCAGCRGAKIRVIPCSAVPDDAYVVDASYMGAPTVSIEKLDSSQAEAAAHAVLKVWSRLVFWCCASCRALWGCRTQPTLAVAHHAPRGG